MTNAHVALTAALLTLAALLIPPPVGAATAQCDGGRFVPAYESGLVSFESGDFAAAFVGLFGIVMAVAVVIAVISPLIVIWWLTRPTQPETNQWGPPPAKTGGATS